MIVLFCFLLSSFGVTNILTGGKIFQWLRDLLEPIPVVGYLFKCPMCLGFWVGSGWFMVGLQPAMNAPYWVEVVAAGMIASGTSWIARVILHHFGEDLL